LSISEHKEREFIDGFFLPGFIQVDRRL